MIKFLYAPPFAGSNFLAKHLLWDNNPPKNSWYKEEDNEYQIDREIADKVSNTGREMAFMFLIGKKDIFEKIFTLGNKGLKNPKEELRNASYKLAHTLKMN